jgi:hypothetical protein
MLMGYQAETMGTENKISRAPVSTDLLSAVSVIRGSLRSEKKMENYSNERFVSLKTFAKRERAVRW